MLLNLCKIFLHHKSNNTFNNTLLYHYENKCVLFDFTHITIDAFLVINSAIRKLSKQHKPGGHYTRILYSDQFFHQRFAMTNTFWCQFQILLNQRNEQQIR